VSGPKRRYLAALVVPRLNARKGTQKRRSVSIHAKASRLFAADESANKPIMFPTIDVPSKKKHAISDCIRWSDQAVTSISVPVENFGELNAGRLLEKMQAAPRTATPAEEYARMAFA
jgi:hypothetical protein